MTASWPYPERLIEPNHWAKIEELQRERERCEAPFRRRHRGADFLGPVAARRAPRVPAFDRAVAAGTRPLTRAEIAAIVGDGRGRA